MFEKLLNRTHSLYKWRDRAQRNWNVCPLKLGNSWIRNRSWVSWCPAQPSPVFSCIPQLKPEAQLWVRSAQMNSEEQIRIVLRETEGGLPVEGCSCVTGRGEIREDMGWGETCARGVGWGIGAAEAPRVLPGVSEGSSDENAKAVP